MKDHYIKLIEILERQVQLLTDQLDRVRGQQKCDQSDRTLATGTPLTDVRHKGTKPANTIDNSRNEPVASGVISERPAPTNSKTPATPNAIETSGTLIKRKVHKGGSPKLSVIIPVFNKESYLSACLDSILANGYENIEVLCIDDCSTDNSRQLTLDSAKSDKRIRPLMLKENSGASVARNLGLQEATGEYVFFADADDLVVDGAFETLIKKAEQCESDIVRAKITGITNDGTRHKLAKEHLLHDHDVDRTNWRNEESLWFYWYFTSNLYRYSFLKQQCIRFPSNMRNEDPIFLCRAFLATEKISLHNDVVYQYRVNSEQKRKTPSYSFLRGWALGNYYLSQFIQNSGAPFQYFLAHLPSVEAHCTNIVRHLERDKAMKYLRYISLLYSKFNFEYIADSKSQPWERKSVMNPKQVRFIDLLMKSELSELYSILGGLPNSAKQ